MECRKGVYFAADVHLGLKGPDKQAREDRFVRFLQSIPRDSEALWLLGDIWDFWYEYHDVIPKEGIRVVAELIALVDAGVKVYFIPGNHDVWAYRFFEEIGIRKVEQPCFVEISGKKFALAHGDGIGGATLGYRILRWVFHSKVLQALFSTIHPYLAFRLGTGWSGANRRSHKEYVFVPENERSYRWAVEQEKMGKAEFFIIGHFHAQVMQKLPLGGTFVVLGAWFNASPYLYFDGETLSSLSF